MGIMDACPVLRVVRASSCAPAVFHGLLIGLWDAGYIFYCNNQACDEALTMGSITNKYNVLNGTGGRVFGVLPEDGGHVGVPLPGGPSVSQFVTVLGVISLTIEAAIQGFAFYTWATAKGKAGSSQEKAAEADA